MASATKSPLLLLAVAVALLAASATARPCKTFLVSSYSFSFPNPRDPSASSGFVTVFTEIRQLNPRPVDLRFLPVGVQEPRQIRAPTFSSLHDRTKDILSVVISLLFGVGCGALTAASMYLLWTVFAGRFEDRDSFGDDSDVEDVFSPKKGGYVKIPADAAHAPAAKEAAAVAY